METNSNIEPRLQTGCAQPYVAIPIQVTLKDWGKTNATVNELIEWLNAKKIKIAGPLFHRYYVVGDAENPFDIEVGFPVSTLVDGDARVICGNIPNGTFATLVHCGHPDELEQSFYKLNIWATSQNLQWKTHIENNRQVWEGRFVFFMNADEPDMNKRRTAIAILNKINKDICT